MKSKATPTTIVMSFNILVFNIKTKGHNLIVFNPF